MLVVDDMSMSNMDLELASNFEEDDRDGMLVAQANVFPKQDGRNRMEPRKMVDITRDKPIKVTIRVVVPVRDHPKFNFVGKLLGPKGNSLKRLQEETMTKMAILGRGSMRDRHKDYNDEIRQEQMWEMHVINSGKSATSGDSDDAEDADSSRASTCPSTTDHHITTPTGVGSSCRKRPLAAHGTGTRAAIAMSPTKRTVLSILARARAAQAKHISRPLSNGRQLAVRIKTSGLIAPGPDLVIN
ncbi:KH domain-containing, RNA-binding, signal transduction-associated protein 2 isoform X3 [Nilaparvata lugens]|uniref:KH domain-containing, RNA-binding, signal transduction-associated protein 2 isoform X3 n=1 Tax=Nilaparvata lugens TaxID=108931 RepID=UPI00193D4F38|nr:KH domain-containing, RNA-binding, signal transduction-associated protein 2 isoform X3 [Nilaparvata lugens]